MKYHRKFLKIEDGVVTYTGPEVEFVYLEHPILLFPVNAIRIISCGSRFSQNTDIYRMLVGTPQATDVIKAYNYEAYDSELYRVIKGLE